MIDIGELIDREKIRDDKPFNFLNKMTDQEIEEYKEQVTQLLKQEETKEGFPDWNAAFTAKVIDREILYNVLALGRKEENYE